MSARTGMTSLVRQVREMTFSGTADYTSGTANFWDDDHVQEILDRHRMEVYQELLVPFPDRPGGGSIWYRQYRSRFKHFEQYSGTADPAVFTIEDTTGADAGTALWTADYERGIVTFAANTGGTAYLLTGRCYDLFGAAGELLKATARMEALSFDFTTDGQQFNRNQKYKALLEMADEMLKQAWPVTVMETRDDVQPPQFPGYERRRTRNYADHALS